MSVNLLLINHECGQKKVCMWGGNVAQRFDNSFNSCGETHQVESRQLSEGSFLTNVVSQ